MNASVTTDQAPPARPAERPCRRPSPSGLACTRPAGHRGRHVTHGLGVDGKIRVTWDRHR